MLTAWDFGIGWEDFMSVSKFILRLLKWLVTIILQLALPNVLIFLFSLIFAGADTLSRAGWLAFLLVVWLGYVVGINLAGQAAIRWAWMDVRALQTQRLLATAVGALIPLLILVAIGSTLPVGVEGTPFYDLVTNNWQPALAQASLLAAVIGFYVPGLFPLTSKSTK
jgi:hypothetical protein